MFRIALSQINTTVGDLKGNTEKIIEALKRSRTMGVDLVAFPELAVTGYPPEDLLLKARFIKQNIESIHEIAQHAKGVSAVVGFADHTHTIHNGAAILHAGRVAGVYHKIRLPNYGVFDEKRYFEPGSHPLVLQLRGGRVGINICEDIWIPDGVTEAQIFQGEAELIINISSSPYHAGKGRQREKMLASRAKKNRTFIAYVNLVGGQDELVFDGQSLIFNESGTLIAQGNQFEEDFIIHDLKLEPLQKLRSKNRGLQKRAISSRRTYDIQFLDLGGRKRAHRKLSKKQPPKKRLTYSEEIYQALVLGTRDYVRKNGFRKVVIGLSGGIDSALTATIAVDALGNENVVGVTMPSQYSSVGSVTDSEALAKNLRIELKQIPIAEPFDVLTSTLNKEFAHLPEDITEENLQARIRGVLLMALSNKFGWLVLAPGNKSEMSVGYCTLYGDMVGGFAVIKDVPKTLIYKLARYRNRAAGKKLIPQSIITKEPSAELKPDQRDLDSLPPYPILDRILEAYVENDKSIREIADMGYDEKLVKHIARMVDANEYKRRQGPPGIKITPRAFGKDRRIPITNWYKD